MYFLCVLKVAANGWRHRPLRGEIPARREAAVLRGTGAGVGVDSAWEQKNSRPENACKSRARSAPASSALHLPWGSARVILVLVQDALLGGFVL